MDRAPWPIAAFSTNLDDMNRTTEDGGIERLLALAAVDHGFARALERDRRRAVRASGVPLSPTEAGILDAVDPRTLARMIDGVRGTIPAARRREFLGRSAAALLALVSGAVPLGGCKKKAAPPPEKASPEQEGEGKMGKREPRTPRAIFGAQAPLDAGERGKKTP